MTTYDVIIFTDISCKLYHTKSLGAYRVASEARSHGFSVLVVDRASYWFADPAAIIQLLKLVVGPNTLCIAYSATFMAPLPPRRNNISTFAESYNTTAVGQIFPCSVTRARLVHSYVKQQWPAVKIVVGGSIAIDERLVEAKVDYVIKDEADSTFVAALRALQTRTPRFSVKNGVKVISAEQYPGTFEFNNSQTHYSSTDFITPATVLPLETSRGCMFRCSFCNYRGIGRPKSQPEYLKSAALVAEEIRRNFDEFGVTWYNIVDDTFNESTQKIEVLVNELEKQNLKINFSAYLRLDLIARFPEQIPLLKELGLAAAFLGIETLNPDAAKAIGKFSNISVVKDTLTLARESWGDNVAIQSGFIFGLPHETAETCSEWMQWVIGRPDLIDGFLVYPLGLSHGDLPLSHIQQYPEKYGYTVSAENQWVNNRGFTSAEAAALANEVMLDAFSSGRLLVSGWDWMGFKNIGLTEQELRKTAVSALPFAKINQLNQTSFEQYRQQLLAHLLTDAKCHESRRLAK